jgi:hypothetical protein
MFDAVFRSQQSREPRNIMVLLQKQNQDTIRQSLEKSGIEFLSNGVRISQNSREREAGSHESS